MINSTSRTVWQRQPPVHLPAQPPADALRCLVAQCKALASRYHATPEVALERAWWQSLHDAGICLHETLEASRDQWERLGLTDTEVEHAYYTLIQVAYFFEPGGVAEIVFQEQGWVWSDEKRSEYASKQDR
ncbi:MAG TPA: hypothetical protein VKT82_10655 [Ktedonobacterales bacterium]|nr:hypothetical protein [Ktedonobacterales bacterium]